MKKSYTKILCVVMAFAFIVSFTACGANTSSQDSTSSQTAEQTTAVAAADSTQPAQVTLKLWQIWSADSESNKKPFAKVLADFQAKYPNIKLEVDANEAQAYQTKIKTAVAADEMPDVFYTQAAGFMQPFVEAGKVLALDDYLKDGTMDRIIPGTLTNMTFDGKVYGLPYTLACAVFFVNKEMFDQNGIKIPTNWSELTTAVKAFRGKGITPMALGAKDLWPSTQYFDIIAVRDAGYQPVADALMKKGNFEDPGILDAAKKFKELVDLKAFPDGTLGLTRDESEVPFYEGKIPMYVNGNWTCANIQKEDSKVKGKIEALKFPLIEGGKGDINDFTGGAAECFAVSANTKYKDEATTLVKYIAENHSREAYLAGAGMPTWKMSVDESQIDPLIQQVVKNTSEAKTFTLWWNTQLTGKDMDLYQNELVNLIAGKDTPEQFCKNLQTIEGK